MQHSYDINKIRLGDVLEFRHLFEFMYPKLKAMAARFVDNEVGKDLVQEVFVEYWEQRRHADIKNTESYLYKSLQNKCLNHIKHQSVEHNYAVRLRIAQARIDYINRTADDHDPYRQLNNTEIRNIIELSVQKLPAQCQKAFRLCYFQELTCKEAAHEMGISHRTVEGHIQRAIVQLRDELQRMIGN